MKAATNAAPTKRKAPAAVPAISPETLAKALAPVLRKLVEREVERAQTKTLADAYQGVWGEQDAPYARGELVTHGGSLFMCFEDTSDKPGTSMAWQLCVQRGRDGKRGRKEDEQ